MSHEGDTMGRVTVKVQRTVSLCPTESFGIPLLVISPVFVCLLYSSLFWEVFRRIFEFRKVNSTCNQRDLCLHASLYTGKKREIYRSARRACTYCAKILFCSYFCRLARAFRWPQKNPFLKESLYTWIVSPQAYSVLVWLVGWLVGGHQVSPLLLG